MALIDPPGGLDSVSLPVARPPQRLIRLNLGVYPNPVHWSKRGDYRFDSPTAKYGVFYTSTRIETAILEVFGDRRLPDRQIDFSTLEEYEVCEIEVKRRINVVNVTGKHLNRLGIDSNFFATTDYNVTQKWGRAFMTHPQQLCGIRYNSRKHPDRINFALFGRPETKAALRVLKRYPLVSYDRLYRFLLSYDVSII
jgi:RES domain